MRLIDTHCHLYLSEFEADIDEVLNRAIAEGVSKFYLPSIDTAHFTNLLQLEKQYPFCCIATAGLHPCYVKEEYLTELDFMRSQLESRDFVAIGEIGLDYYWDKTFSEQQIRAFETQMEWALEFNRPIIIHTRNAMQDTINAVKPFAKRGLTGIFHCFSGSYESAKQIIDLGFNLGIGGVITYKNSGLPEVIEQVGLSHLVLETDAPYLTPVPYRGKRNESSYLKIIAHKLADATKQSIETVAATTTKNAERIFGV